MSGRISLSVATRSNLLSLQQVSKNMDKTQDILSSNQKVNSAVDNPSSYYTARSLNNRAQDLESLLDSMGQKIQTISVALEGIETATKYLDLMTSAATQALDGNDVSGYVSKIVPEIYNGKSVTDAIADYLEEDALAANAVSKFHVLSENDENYDQGKWYLPSIGELMEAYGINIDDIGYGDGNSGAPDYDDSNIKVINDTLEILEDEGVATQLSGYYWSSTEATNHSVWRFSSDLGDRTVSEKDNTETAVRAFQLIENVYRPSKSTSPAPEIGDVMYSDLSWGKGAAYDSSKTAIGVITHVSDDGRDVTIINLKDLTFGSNGTFDADHPYTNDENTVKWCADIAKATNIPDVTNYNVNGLKTNIQTINNEDTRYTTPEKKESSYQKQFNEILKQYDTAISDSGYQGVNLLTGEMLEVTFNEEGNHKLTIEGKDIRSSAIGLHGADWEDVDDIRMSIKELQTAVADLRSFASNLGNNNSIIQIRQSFTENLINVLEEGADKLTLADMNEASATYLALQTRQQLAINALSLANQSEQSILKLF